MSNRRQLGRGPLEIIEEAVHLLRLNSATALAAYYIGSLPFILALLYFWASMSMSPFARKELPGASLGLALLFLWMKFWHAVFAANLRARISATPPVRWTPRRCLRVFIVQTAVQPTALILLPLALLPAALPFGWVNALYENVTVFADGETSDVRRILKRAWKQSFLWPAQNIVILIMLFAFALYVFLNLGTFCLFLPNLAKMLLGIDSVYTQSPMSMLNTTFFAALYGLTYLCVDPILKTAYLLRCFYGESLQSGEDLKAEIKQFSSITAATAGLLMLCLFIFAPSTRAADTNSSATPAVAPIKSATPAISAPDLDKTINQVIHQPKYTWRMPRETVVEESKDGPIMGFIRGVLTWIKERMQEFFKSVWHLIKWIWEWIKKLFSQSSGSSGSAHSFDWVRSMQSLLFVLLVVVACALAIFVLRLWQKSRRKALPVASQAIAPLPDLSDENVGADQLPEDGWIKLGRELLSQGELRLALRAFYFASLAHLATRNLITIARFKSNRDYERELRRRGHALPDILSLFGENVAVFDRSWYGMHDINPDMVGQFLSNVERIKTGA